MEHLHFSILSRGILSVLLETCHYGMLTKVHYSNLFVESLMFLESSIALVLKRRLLTFQSTLFTIYKLVFSWDTAPRCFYVLNPSTDQRSIHAPTYINLVCCY